MTGYYKVGKDKTEEVDVMDEQDTENEEPKMCKVLVINDDYTTMEFVMKLLIKVFYKNEQEAEAITMAVHNKGQGVAGIFTKEVAEAKRYQAEMWAREEEHPLKLEVEKE